MKKPIEFETPHDIEGNAIAIERTPDFFMVAQQLSEFIYGLPLDQPTNDRLVALMVDQVQQAEKGAFAHGFRMGMIFEGSDQIADQQWQAEFDEDKRRYDQEYEQEYGNKGGSGGSGSSGGNGGNGGNGGGDPYKGKDLGGMLADCATKEEAMIMAAEMEEAGHPEAWDLFYELYPEPEKKPSSGSSGKKPSKPISTGKFDHATLT